MVLQARPRYQHEERTWVIRPESSLAFHDEPYAQTGTRRNGHGSWKHEIVWPSMEESELVDALDAHDELMRRCAMREMTSEQFARAYDDFFPRWTLDGHEKNRPRRCCIAKHNAFARTSARGTKCSRESLPRRRCVIRTPNASVDSVRTKLDRSSR